MCIGIPGIKASLLEEFGVRLITYDLPGFGESDPHPIRNLNSSALDIQFLADALGITEKFWLVAHSSGTMHAWAALRYIPHRVAGNKHFYMIMLEIMISCFAQLIVYPNDSGKDILSNLCPEIVETDERLFSRIILILILLLTCRCCLVCSYD